MSLKDLGAKLHSCNDGTRFWIRGDPTCDEHVVNEVWETDCYCVRDAGKSDAIARGTRSGTEVRTVVDLGGNIGVFSVLAAKEFPLASIITVEPDSDNLVMLRANLELHGIAGRVRIVEKALWYDDLGAVLISEHGLSQTCAFVGTAVKNRMEVPTVTLEEIMNVFDWVDLMKVDVEGAEIQSFLLTPAQVLERIRVIVGEYHNARDSSWGEWVRYLATIFDLQLGAQPRADKYGADIGLFKGTLRTKPRVRVET